VKIRVFEQMPPVAVLTPYVVFCVFCRNDGHKKSEEGKLTGHAYGETPSGAEEASG
jgi:hypothetical protein